MISDYPWQELAELWDGHDFGAVHDWLGERWNRLIQERPAGHDDQDAAFLQGLAFAALAFHFTQHGNQDGARVIADDALRVLARYSPSYAGVRLDGLIEGVGGLRSRLEGLENDATCPIEPRAFPCLELAETVQ